MNGGRRVLDLRARVLWIPAGVDAEFEKLYRETVSEVVSDHKVEAAERSRLDVVRKGLSLSSEAAHWFTPAAANRGRYQVEKGEACYHSTPFVEKKLRVARSYQIDGVRHQDKELATERSGQLYITNQRVLLVAD